MAFRFAFLSQTASRRLDSTAVPSPLPVAVVVVVAVASAAVVAAAVAAHYQRRAAFFATETQTTNQISFARFTLGGRGRGGGI